MWYMKVKKVNAEEIWAEEINRYNPERYRWDLIPGSSSKKKAEEYAQIVIEYFNGSLRPHETARELVGVYKKE